MYLTVAAIIGKESPYIREWLEYHLKVGVEKFFLYTYRTDDATLAVINEYVEKGHVVWEGDIDAGPGTQMVAYNFILASHTQDSKWMAFIDADEFLVPKSKDSLPEILKGFENFPALAVHWKIFGSNGHKRYTAKGVIERFTRCSAVPNVHIKSIVQPAMTVRCDTPHYFTYTNNMIAVDENYERVTGPVKRGGTTAKIQINHYATKSLDECNIRRAMPRADNGAIRPDLEAFFIEHDRNETEDLRALQLYRR